MVPGHAREQEEGSQRPLWRVGILLLLHALLLLFGGGELQRLASESCLRKKLIESVRVENRLGLALGGEKVVRVADESFDEGADSTVELGEASYDYGG